MVKYKNVDITRFIDNQNFKRSGNKIKKHDETKQAEIRRNFGDKFYKKYDPTDRDLIKQGDKIIDADTGEDVSHLYEVGFKTPKKKGRSYRIMRKFNDHDTEHGRHILLFFHKIVTMDKQLPSLTKQDIARMLYLATFIKYESNRLQSDNGRKHYTKKDLEEMLSMSTKRFNEFFSRLENENVIQEIETGETYINPTIAYYGSKKSNPYDISDFQHTRLFKDTVRELYQEFKGRRLGQLSVIYSVLPFLNFQSNIICHNPDETSDKLVKPMELKELADLLGYDNSSRLKQTLNRIKVRNEPVFGFFENPHDRRSYRIVVNPRVVFAGNGESLEAIKILFN